MVGTLEDTLTKPNWMWYEEFAGSWMHNPPGSRQRSFSLPTWTNVAHYPLGENDPELQDIKATVSEYTWNRRYAAIPTGVNNPVFPRMYEPGIEVELLTPPDDDTYFMGGGIGVDYGSTWEHPSAVVAVSLDNHDRYWVREAWKGVRVRYNEIADMVDIFKQKYDITDGCVDPNQHVLADMLNFSVASGGRSGDGLPTETRFRYANELLDEHRLFFDIMGPNVREVWGSMKLMGHMIDKRGQRRYARPLNDDLGQALMYAIEGIKNDPGPPVPLVLGQGYAGYTVLPKDSNRGRA